MIKFINFVHVKKFFAQVRKMKKILFFITLVFLFVGFSLSIPNTALAETQNQTQGFIVTTFPSLVDDVKLITGNYFTVVSIVPPGVDPHDYSLTPQDVDILKNATLIISTLHAPVEVQIDNYFKSGLLHSYYIAIPNITGIVFVNNPNNGLPDPHMPIYDPNNYLKFLYNLTLTVSEIDPSHKQYYMQNYENISNQVESLIEKYEGKYRGTAVASTPEAVYAINWLGFNVTRLLLTEEEASVSPQDVNTITSMIKNGTANAVAILVSFPPQNGSVSPYSQYDSRLYNIYTTYKKGFLLEVPSPVTGGSILSKLQFIVAQLSSYNNTSNYTSNSSISESTASSYVYIVIAIILIVLITVLLYYWRSRRQNKK
ncbi:MAG TPA: hypothetical protein ENO39_02315 [Fervidicoccus fontis]|uniref:ABC transporter substrate-binding protein n=2 Tax=Fervidicoccus fontis TaxID=683846 RepID=A0A7C2ZWD9_9CREN|nr:hypothetical protein [Fervidicoccus fontis]